MDKPAEEQPGKGKIIHINHRPDVLVFRPREPRQKPRRKRPTNNRPSPNGHDAA